MENKKELGISMFEQVKNRFVQLTNEESFLKEASFAIQAINKNSYLASMDRGSIIQSLLNVSQTGLTLNPVLKLAHLIPRNGKCCLDVSYQGMVKLLTDTGSVKNVYAYIIHAKDIFEQSMGTSVEIIHKPKLSGKGEITGVYAVGILHDGKKQVEVMNIEEINAIRDRSESYKAFIDKKIKSCVWHDFYDEMARKTVIKRLCKYLPKTDKWEKVSTAIEIDNEDYKISNGQASLIESLIQTASWNEEKKRFVLESINDMSFTEATETIQDLKNHQLDPIASGNEYSQTQIGKKLDQLK